MNNSSLFGEENVIEDDDFAHVDRSLTPDSTAGY